jgi:predicted CoA-substrate-specific enzyme activase
MTWICGIDVGTASTKAVLAKDGEPYLFHQISSGHNYKETAARVLKEIANKGNLVKNDISQTYATGCGASQVTTDNETVGDLACCAQGVHHLLPDVRTVIEVGDRGTKVLRVNEKGKAIKFVMSERCATGCGRFLTIIARVLQLNPQDVGSLSLTARNPVPFATGCAVFGESEAISRVAEGTPKEDILAGVHMALATKIATMIERVGFEGPCAMAGGGALDRGLLKQVEERIGDKVHVPELPQFAVAIGAALYIEENLNSLNAAVGLTSQDTPFQRGGIQSHTRMHHNVFDLRSGGVPN